MGWETDETRGFPASEVVGAVVSAPPGRVNDCEGPQTSPAVPAGSQGQQTRNE